MRAALVTAAIAMAALLITAIADWALYGQWWPCACIICSIVPTLVSAIDRPRLSAIERWIRIKQNLGS